MKNYEQIISMIDTIIRNHGRSNLIFKSELEQLKKDILELKEKEAENETRTINHTGIETN